MGKTPKGLMTFERRESYRVSRPGADTRVVSSRLEMGPLDAEFERFGEPSGVFDARQKELECARLFNFEIPEDLVMAVHRFEQCIQSMMGTHKSVILLFDEVSGTYTCLNDQKTPNQKPRELTLVSDHFLQELLGSDDLIHTYLLGPQGLIGLVAVAKKLDGTVFNAQDDITLDIMARYLATKVLSFQNLKESLSLPFIQNVVLEISNRLIAAVDQDSILTGTLESLVNRLEVDACQFVAPNLETGEGNVLLENRQGAMFRYALAQVGDTAETAKGVKEFSAIISLFSSTGRRNPYLLLNSPMLGDKPLAEVFGVPGIESALMVPVMDATTGRLAGVLNLFKTHPGIVSDDTVTIAKEVALLVSLALGRASALEKAWEMASSDELTGLTNRRGFYDRFESEIERSRRHQTATCVAMIDVDHFKRLNDTYGHLNGDIVLQALAKLLAQNVRKSDVVCRFGGEEFALLLPDTSLKSAMELVERVRQKIQRHRIRGLQGEALRVTISAGVSLVPTTQGLSRPGREIISEAMAAADEQLYQAKSQGRNQVCASESGVPVEA